MRGCFRRYILFLSFCILTAPALIPDVQSQSLTLFELDTRSYPLLRAGFFAFDVEGHRLIAFTPEDFVLTENGIPRRVLDVTCPQSQTPSPLSAVLTVDVSGSMIGSGLALARTAAGAWIDAFPTGQSECALTSFNTTNALHQDFTNDKLLIREAVDRLEAGGGTSFDAALIDPFAGAIGIAARGKYKKVVVLLTDGQASGNEQNILDLARQSGVQIFCITLDNVMPGVLRNVAEQSGGRWFENVTNADEARRIYRGILEEAQDLAPCVITWESEGCAYFRSVECTIPEHAISENASYSVTNAELPRITVLPRRVIEFGVIAQGTTDERSVTLQGEGRPVDISAITPEFPQFAVTDYGGAAPPFTLFPGQQRTITISYTAEDSAYMICRFFIETNACEAGFFATGGAPGSGRDRRVIKLLHPNGGEMFVAGSDTVITWEGVAPTDPVRLEYSTNNGAAWRKIADNVTGLSYNWHVPNTPSDECLVRVTARLPAEVPDDMVIIPAGTFVMGDLSGIGTQDEHPTSRVTISRPFLMGRTEVTKRQWREIGAGTSNGGDGPDDGPAHSIDMREALEYCNSRSVTEGLQPCYTFNAGTVFCDFDANGYRLATEAEWELACRAGVNADFYTGMMLGSFCTPVDPNLDIAGWYCGNAGGSFHTVGQKVPNAFGLLDMHGNVRELCWGDAKTPYTANEKVDPRDPNPMMTSGSANPPVTRGGWIGATSTECRSSMRYFGQWGVQSFGNGFRVVRTY